MPANHCIPHTEAAKAKMSAARLGKPLLAKRRPIQVIDGITLFLCGSCKCFLPSESFHANKRTVLGLKSQCRACHSRSSLASRNPANTRRLRRESEARRRARKAGTTADIPRIEMAAIGELWGAYCLLCGATEALQWDHVMPLAKGGEHSISNLQRLCRIDNERKQARYADYRSDAQKVWALTFKVVPDAS